MNEQEIEHQIINIQLSVAEINVVLRCLGKHPFDEIAALIGKIKSQGQAQLIQLNSTEDTTND